MPNMTVEELSNRLARANLVAKLAAEVGTLTEKKMRLSKDYDSAQQECAVAQDKLCDAVNDMTNELGLATSPSLNITSRATNPLPGRPL